MGRHCLWISLIMLATFSGIARSQALAEYARSDRRSAKAGTHADKATKGIGDVWRSLDGVLKTGNAGSRTTPSIGTAQRTSVGSRAGNTRIRHRVTKKYEDPNEIRPGMAYEEVMRRFGPPYYGVSTGPDTKTLAYLGKDGGVNLELQGGKVIKVSPERPQVIAAAK